MRQRNKRNIVIGILCVMVVFMSVGYAVLSQNLNINGTANITGSWKIEITSISPEEINEGESLSEVIEDSKVAGSFEANLKKPTDAVIYTVTVENKGTINAVLESITPEDYSEGDIKYTTTGKEECKNLDAGSSCDFTIKVEYLDTGAGQIPTPNGTEVKQEFEIKYVQEGASVNIPDNGNDNEEIIVNESAFKVTDNGLLLHYERQGDETSVVVPGEVSKTPVKQTSFNTSNNNLVGNLLNDKTKEFKQAKTSTEKIQIKEIAPYAFIDADAIVANNSSLIIVINMDYIELGKQLAQMNGMTLTTIDEFGHGSDPFEIINVNQKMTVDMSKPQIAVDSTEYDSNYYLTDLDLSNMIYLEKIGDSAFENFDLTKISLPIDGVLTSIGDRAFSGNQISEITIPESVTTIGEFILDNSGFFRKIEINAENIPEDLIYVSPNELVIEKLIIGPNVKSISNGMFYKADGLVTIRNLNIDAEIIPDQIFNSRKIENLIIGPNVKIIEGSAFANNLISRLIVPENVTRIDTWAFRGNKFLYSTDITIEYNEVNLLKRFSDAWTLIGFPGNQIVGTKIGCYFVDEIMQYKIIAYAPSDICSTNIEIPSELNGVTITAIGANAFKDIELTNVIIPSSVTIIEQDSFANATIASLNINVKKISEGVFNNIQIQKLTLGSNVTEISPSAFEYSQISGELIIPSNITTIGDFAFHGNKIEKLTFENTKARPSQIKSLSNGAFSSNQISGELIIPSNIEELKTTKTGDDYVGVFQSNLISKLVFEDTNEKPSQLKTIGYNSFNGNQITGELLLPRSVITIESLAFSGNQISDLNLPASMTILSNGAFAYNQISKLTMPESLTVLGEGVFRGNNLTELIIPSSVTTIGEDAFFGNANLTKIIIKRADSSGMSFATDWNLKSYSPETTYYEVVYDPNYVGE